jgi:hypothetical protein
MSFDIETVFEQLSSYGTAPKEGCSLFGVGYESHFERLRSHYLQGRFSRGGSAQKYVIGPFGSGKTHFLRQLMEIGREEDCVTIEVALNKNLDFDKLNVVYKEMARTIQAPGIDAQGIKPLVREALRRIESRATAHGLDSEVIVRKWAAGIDEANLALGAFARVARKAAEAVIDDRPDVLDAATAWLSGEFADTAVSRRVEEVPAKSEELNSRTHAAKQALFQFVRYCGFRGTVVGFDEAEQGLAVDKKRMSKIFSHLLSELNSIVDLKNGSVMIVYAITPDLVAKITTDMPMLQQRLADPGPNQGFFDGNHLAPKIDLTLQTNHDEDLGRIGGKLTHLFFDRYPGAAVPRRDEALRAVPAVVEEVLAREASSSARRELVKAVCFGLLSSYTSSPGAPVSPMQVRESEV